MYSFQGKKREKCLEFHIFLLFQGGVLVLFQTYKYHMGTLEILGYAGLFQFSKFHIEIYIFFVAK